MAIDPVLVGGLPVQDIATAPLPAPSATKLTQEQAAQAGVVPGPSADSNAATRAGLEREKATPIESFGAAASQWGVFSVMDAFTKVHFDKESPATFDINANFEQLQFVPTDGQRKVLNGVSSRQEFWYTADKMRESEQASRAMQDNPATSFLGSAIDPSYIAIDAIMPGVGRSLAAGRAGAGRALTGGLTFGATAGMGVAQQSVLGTETSQIILDSALNAAIPMVLYNRLNGKLEAVDSQYPSAEITALNERATTVSGFVRRLDEQGQPVVRNGKEVWTPVLKDNTASMAENAGILNEATSVQGPLLREGSPWTYGDTRASDALRAIESNPMAKALLDRAGPMLDNVKVRVVPDDSKLIPQGSPGIYSMGKDTIIIRKGAPETALTHEVAHALTAHKIEYGLKNPNSVHGRIVNELADTLDRAREYADIGGVNKRTQYYLDNLHEFTAGLFSGNIEFTRMLSKMADTSTGGNLLGALVTGIRRLLGMKPSEQNALVRAMALTDELVGAPSVERATSPYHLNEAPDAKQMGKFMDNWSAKELGSKLAWSLNKSLGRFSEEAKKITNKFWDDPLDMTGDSVESQKRAILADLRPAQYAFEGGLLDAMQTRGISTWQRVFKPQQAKAVEQQITREVVEELSRREHYARVGTPVPASNVPADILKLADSHDAMMKTALAELKAAGVEGAEQIAEASGYFQRRWDVTKMEDLMKKFEQVDGMTEAQSKVALKRLVSRAVQKANGWDDELSSDIGGAIVDRTFRKGYGEDQPFLANFGKMTVTQVRDILSSGGVHGPRLERALEVMTGAVDEAGKVAMLKHRIDMDIRTSSLHKDGTTSNVVDLWDHNLPRLAEHYIEVTASQAALARKGYKSSTDIAQARSEYLRSIESKVERDEAAKLWDNSMAQLQGQPVGEDMPRAMRMAAAVNQAITLGFSGLWQVTEFGNLVGKYGITKTTSAMFKQLNGSRELYDMVSTDRAAAKHLTDLLARNSSQDIRLRPYVQKLEDNFDIPVTDAMQLGLSQVQQLVPYINAMKFVTHYQARIAANLVVDVFDRAVRGDARAISELEKYGFKRPLLENISDDVKGSLNTADWSDGTWEAVRGPLTKMMDESVLRSRSGEIPAFVQHTSAGKVLFTYRNFVLAAHNKVLSGGLHRDGYQGVGMIALYQFPLTVLATAAHNGMAGKKPMEPDELVTKSIGQMGVMGLLSEVWGIATGDKTRVNIAATIPFDRVYNIGGAVARGDGEGALKGAVASVPLVGIIPGIRTLTSKDD